MIKIFIIILNFKGADNTIDCLASLQKLNLPKSVKVEPIVVDNGSHDNSVKKIREKFPTAMMIENQTNLGFTGGNNEGIRFALKSGASHVMLLNNDTRVDSNLIINLYESMSIDDSIALVLPKIYFEAGFEFHKKRYKQSEKGSVIWYAGGKMDWNNLIGINRGVDEVDHGQYDTREETELATGCCFMIRTELIKKIGLFDNKYFLYYEDADLSERIKKVGFRIIYEPKAIVWHKNAESSGGSGSDLQDYYITRNRFLFGMRYAPIRTRLALVRESVKLLSSGRKWQKKGAIDFYLRRFGRGTFPI